MKAPAWHLRMATTLGAKFVGAARVQFKKFLLNPGHLNGEVQAHRLSPRSPGHPRQASAARCIAGHSVFGAGR
jgi:hypothetical protein